jgi:hypothetical protein
MMAGLIFIALIIGWFFLARWLARKLTSRIQSKPFRIVSIGLLIASFSVLLVIDEIISGFQFRALCDRDAVLRIDEQRIKGKVIAEVINPSNQDVPETATRIYFSRFGYVDTATGEELASHSWFTAEGGKLIQFLAGGHQMPPLTPMSQRGNTCRMQDQGDLARKYGFTYQSTLGK